MVENARLNFQKIYCLACSAAGRVMESDEPTSGVLISIYIFGFGLG